MLKRAHCFSCLAALLLIFRAALSCFDPTLNEIEEFSLRGELQEAQNLAEKMLQEKNLPEETRLYLFHKTLWLLLERERYEDVIVKARLAANDDSFASLMHGVALRHLGLLSEAEKVLKGNTHPASLQESGTIRFLKGDAKGAREFYKNAPLHSDFMALSEEKPEDIKADPAYLSGSISELASLYLSAKKELLTGTSADALNTYNHLLEKDLPKALKKALFFEFGTLSATFAQDPSLKEEEKRFHFERGSKAFMQLIEAGEKEKGWMALGNSHLMLLLKGALNLDSEPVITALNTLQTPESLQLASILRAESEPDLKKKEALYNSFPLSEDAWKLRIRNLRKLSAYLSAKGFHEEGIETLKKTRDFIGEFNSPMSFSINSAEDYFLKGLIAENQGLYNEKRAFFKELIDRYPEHPLREEAEFNFYTLTDYFSGGRAEIKHLQQFTEKHKESHYLPLAYTIIGLDLKKDRKNEEGKWIRKKSLTAAIDAFSLSVSTFEYLKGRDLIPKERLEAYSKLALNARLEQGECNFEIAKESKGAKKQLFLEYSKEVLSPLTELVEAKLLLTEVLIGLNEMDEAKYKAEEIIASTPPQEFYSAKANRLLAEVSTQEGDYQKALQSLELVEKCKEGFSLDERLSIALQKGCCLKSLKRLDEAMTVFSSVVNASVVSSLRIEGMFERATIYKEQNRMDLYRKQLEAIIKIGGKWQEKARQLLETHG